MKLPDSASLVRLALRVRDIESCLAYYTEVLGLGVVEQDGNRTSIAPADRQVVIDLHHEPDAPLRPYPCPGLFHFALVVPDRSALGAIFRRLLERNVPLDGMSDHAVSEAVYLRDPEHNGIELYRDRPREEWPYDEDGQIAMVTDPLDVDGLFESATASAELDAGTRFGHIHLHVRSLQEADAFYAGTLGLDVTQRSLPGALFLSVGGYHHHVAANTWAPTGDVPDGATGLISYTWRVPSGWSGPDESIRDPAGADVLFETG
ncbi:MAG TPA: VOC family protein [Actinomycetota bacterium]|nr:VOC family protein [Actinomycetota bacterium]